MKAKSWNVCAKTAADVWDECVKLNIEDGLDNCIRDKIYSNISFTAHLYGVRLSVIDQVKDVFFC